MEFQFYRLDRQTVNVTCSMEHEAVARWANSEIQGNLAKVQQILTLLQQYQHNASPTTDKILTGKEFSLHINQDEVMVKANILFDESATADTLEEDLQFYDEENIAFCGLEDFIHFLQSYSEFIQE